MRPRKRDTVRPFTGTTAPGAALVRLLTSGQASMTGDMPSPRHRCPPRPPVPTQLCPPPPFPQEVPTLRQLWARGQQVLLSYEEDGVVSRHPELWPGIPYWWGNQVTAKKLIRYLERMKGCGRPGGCAPGKVGAVGPTGGELTAACASVSKRACTCVSTRLDTNKHPQIIHVHACTHGHTGTHGYARAH